MAQRIQLLTETVANQIAAGEVVERPASVVRELLDNALDAEADKIDVEIQRGGKTLIRVTDNGCGMSNDDALLSLERHATSKIRSMDDLQKITSYGFRGEALSSIASVSRFRLLTREKSANAGTEIVVEGGKIIRAQEAGCPVGTTVEARSLFFNLPARRKFLKSDLTEWAHIEQCLRLVSLAQPELYLTAFHNNQKILQYPKASSLSERLMAVFGKKWMEEMLPVEASRNDMKLFGVIGKPGVSRSNRQEQYLFVNGRCVQNATLNFALLDGYHTALVKGRYPVAVLFLEMEPSRLDVNVHPAKKEVRFHQNDIVRNFVSQFVADILRGTPQEIAEEIFLKPPPPPAPLPVTPALNFISSPPLPTAQEQDFSSRAVLKTAPVEKNHSLNVVGVILNLYIIAEGDQGLVLIDQRAAHLRILFETMLKRLEKAEILSQALLLPATLEFAPDQADILRRQIKALQKIGIGISEMGGRTFMIDALPAMIHISDVEHFIRDVVSDLQDAGVSAKRSKRLSEEEIAGIVCQRAVRAKDSLKAEEIDRLLRDLHDCDLPYTCPQGRPTMIMISRSELERKFGRL
ncbi:MAG: DNA mismatch repair endonuclease MutL [Verrucomicrobiota bacterium]